MEKLDSTRNLCAIEKFYEAFKEIFVLLKSLTKLLKSLFMFSYHLTILIDTRPMVSNADVRFRFVGFSDCRTSSTFYKEVYKYLV